MSLSVEQIDSFTVEDRTYIQTLVLAQTLDPLNIKGTAIVAAMHEGCASEDDLVDLSTDAARLLSRPDIPPEEEVACFRDIDKVFGYFSRTRSAIPEAIQNAISRTPQAHPRPRANAYDFYIGSSENLPPHHLYTGDLKEQNLIRITAAFILAGHVTVQYLLDARQSLRQEGEATDALQSALDGVKDMHSAMLRTYRDVTPEFFTTVMTRRFREIAIRGQLAGGPNASHTVSMLVDRLAGGSFRKLMTNQAMATAFKERLVDMPPHLVRMLGQLDASRDDETILELAKSPDDRRLATEIIATLRKDKVVHKSYADKGLAAKQGRLVRTADGGTTIIKEGHGGDVFQDPLTPNIAHFRHAEKQ